MKCKQCGVDAYMPFQCPYCGEYFCVEHRLPENHGCPEYRRAKFPVDQSAEARTIETKPSYQYTVSVMAPHSQGRLIWFSWTELKHLLAGVLLTLAIGFSMPLYSMPELYGYPEILTALAAVFAFSFIIHELAHKVAAQRHGLWAEFRITTFGALITMVSIVSPFKIISPGAVMVGGMADRETIGKTSIAGPVTNIALALVFLVFSQVFSGSFNFVFYFGLLINSFIALFNLIPFGVLDGYKVFLWSKVVWAVVFSVSLMLTIYSYIVFPFL